MFILQIKINIAESQKGVFLIILGADILNFCWGLIVRDGQAEIILVFEKKWFATFDKKRKWSSNPF